MDVPQRIAELTVGEAISLLVFLIAVTGGIITTVRKIRPFAKLFRNFLDDWNGTEGRPGVEAQPGVMERLSNLENGQSALQDQVREVKRELQPDGGLSVKDKVNKIADAVVPGQRNLDDRY